MYRIQCRVCNKFFDSKLPQYKNCSKECAENYKKVYNKNYQEDNRELISKGVNRRHANNPEKRKKFARISFLNSHGIDEVWFSDKMAQQNGTCALCGCLSNGKNSFHIDHAHGVCEHAPIKSCTKCNRGLLCSHCNTSLGHLEIAFEQMKNLPVPINGTWLEKAMEYIAYYKNCRRIMI